MSYNWSIISMQCYPQHEGQDNVVFKVYFKITKLVTENEIPYLGLFNESVEIPFADSEAYTPYNELTEEQVIGWVKTALGEATVSLYESKVDEQIERMTKPSTVSPPVPWDN
jgi:hypothetical protein